MRKSAVGLLIVLGPFVVLAVLYQLTTSPIDNSRPLEIPQTGPITIALAGDLLITDPLGAAERDQGFVAARSAIRGATFALGNLEMNLREAGEPPSPDAQASRWPWGGERQATFLRELGFDAVTLANDHAADYGVDAVLSTRRVLDAAGILHAGTGEDLAQARAPLKAGRIAVFGVAVSSMPDARATASRAEIKGRAGVNPLRYTADITVDATTFRTLSESAPASTGSRAGESELKMSGATIKKGEQTSVDFVVDPAYAVLCHPSFPMLRFCSDNNVLSFARVACFADAIKSRRVSGVISKLSVVTSGGMGNAITFRLRAAHVGAPGPAT